MTSNELMECLFRDYISKGGGKPGDRLPSTRELMGKYASSLPTVGKALFLLEREGWITKARGRGITLKKVAASGDSSRRSQVIGVVLPEFGMALTSDILHGVEQRAKGQNFFLKTGTSGGDVEKERALLGSMQSAGVSGVVLHPAGRKRGAREYLAEEMTDFPIVVVDLANPAMKRPAVTFDNFSAGAEMTLHCFSENCRRVAFMKLEADVLHRAISDRFEGYLSALQKNGAEFDPSLVIEIPVEGGIIERGLAAAIKRFLEIYPLPDAIIVPTDSYAWLVVQYLESKGYRVPKDVLVCGFDNLQDKYWGCRFPTTNPNCYHMGIRAADLLFDEIQRRDTRMREIVLPCPLAILPQETSVFLEEKHQTEKLNQTEVLTS